MRQYRVMCLCEWFVAHISKFTHTKKTKQNKILDPIKTTVTALNNNINNKNIIIIINFHKNKTRVVWESNLNSTVKNATKTNTILKDLIDLKNGIISFLGSTIRYIIYMQYHIRHLSNQKNPNFLQTHFTFSL